ncbi:MAG: DUF2723 domain-containing protein [Bacteroidales bacterium]|nr:DUF2723 domain-containing protein [Bacteroidales bacterium]
MSPRQPNDSTTTTAQKQANYLIMKQYKILNNLVGWLVFAIAAVVYLMTIEPTGSFWDCGEFTASAYRLEVGHPPGAPFFILTARLFTLLASDPSQASVMVNSMSALLSAFTILFLFWSITHLVRKVIMKQENDYTTGNIIATLGAGAVGALAYTFSDTFWFSAVEAEVYAYSSFFTAIVFWCILKWEDADDKGEASRWIILIAYLMGLSIGVHLLNLLTIPAIVLVYYFKKHEKVTARGIITSIIVSCVILLAVLYGLIPGFTKVAGKFELLFVNGLHMPFNTGLFIYLILTAGCLVWSLWESHTAKSEVRTNLSFIITMILLGVPFLANNIIISILLTILLFGVFFVKNNAKALHLIMMCAMVILVGYSSYAMIMVRSAANPPMDQNSPEDVFSLQSYLNREQYGDRPLLYGSTFNAPEILKVEGRYCKPIEKLGKEKYTRKVKENADEKDSYVSAGRATIGYEMDPRFNMLFPRMYSSKGRHAEAYKAWGNIRGERLTVDRCGQTETRIMPTFGENLAFFFSYQCNFMYWRYFMWNFVGRQNDIQGHGELDHGNWISGIKFIDNARLGNQETLPESLKKNKGHNTYFFLPLLLGILGICWQLSTNKKSKQHFWITLALFFMTGLAIVVYLNQTPYQPRERDYAYAGSFYAFSIWIGIGVAAIWQLLRSIKLPSTVAALIATIASLGVPALMCAQNWDDHDRSNRYISRDTGANYLNTCDENAILFCNGDNDTFPVWYNQEVEGTRTDVRSCNLSYIQTDWYIDQMKRGYYESKPLPINWKQAEYMDGRLDVARVTNEREYMLLSDVLDLLKQGYKLENGIGTIPTQTIVIPVNKEEVAKNHVLSENDSCVDAMIIRLGSMLRKSDIMMLEMINSSHWERPIYISSTVGEEFYPALQRYMRLDGMAYRIVPAEKNQGIDADNCYETFLHRYNYGNMNDPKVYLDENTLRTCKTMRIYLGELANVLINQGDTIRTKEVLDFTLEKVPFTTVPYDYSATRIAMSFYRVGNTEKGDEIMNALLDDCVTRLEWVKSLPRQKRQNVSLEMSPRQNIGIIQEINRACITHGTKALQERSQELFQKYYNEFAAQLQASSN